jgi:hypothetical protein
MTSLARRAMEAQAEAIVKKNGFANLDEYDDESFNISMILFIWFDTVASNAA